MTNRVPCKECGAEILPATAEATGGVCMACKQGIREGIERSKEYYKEQRKYSPARALWSSLVDRVHNTSEGFEGLSDDEKTYYAVGVLDGEVYNGGMHQFFWNSSGGVYESVVDGLLELKAHQALRLVTTAAGLLFDGEVPRDRETRCNTIKEYPDDSSAPMPDWADKIEEISSAYCDDPDGIGDRLDAFAKEKGLIEPFEKPPAEQGGADQPTAAVDLKSE